MSTPESETYLRRVESDELHAMDVCASVIDRHLSYDEEAQGRVVAWLFSKFASGQVTILTADQPQ